MRVVFVYAAENRDYWPYAWDQSRVAPPWPGGSPPPGFQPDWYGAVAGLWHVPAIDAYGGDYFHRSLMCPSDREEYMEARVHVSRTRGIPLEKVKGTLDYQMSLAMYLSVQALNPSAPAFVPRYYVCQRVTDPAFPSKKAALFETLPMHEPGFTRATPLLFPNSRNVASADGAVAWRSTASMVPAVLPPELVPPGPSAALAAEAYKGSLTPNGVAGFDW